MEHEIICRAFQLALGYDQLNIASLASFEVLARKIQLIEERHKDRGQGNIDAIDGGDDHFLFLGGGIGPMTRQNACVCPLLSEWVAEELRKEAAVMKERRKAREERNLARTKKDKKEKGAGE